MKIYTLGTSNRSIENFLEILRFYQISQVVDVRRFPTSKRFFHFKKENLEKILKENKIKYFHFEALGGFREGGYENYTKTEKFKKALKELLELAKKENTVIICAEKFTWKCHRFFIAKTLKDQDFEVLHILEKEKIWNPQKEKRKIKPACEKKSKPEFKAKLINSLTN
jgi:uncharacterized protein (DUF488 family)